MVRRSLLAVVFVVFASSAFAQEVTSVTIETAQIETTQTSGSFQVPGNLGDIALQFTPDFGVADLTDPEKRAVFRVQFMIGGVWVTIAQTRWRGGQGPRGVILHEDSTFVGREVRFELDPAGTRLRVGGTLSVIPQPPER